MKRVLFWRHGQTDWNLQRKFQGQADIELNRTGLIQAERAAALLAGLKPDRVISSDLDRAVNTAAALLALIPGFAAESDPRLRETSIGLWEGMTFDEITGQFPEEMARWESGAVDSRPGRTGETRREVAARMSEAVSEAVAGLPENGLLVVVSHGGAIRSGLLELLDVPHDRWGMLSGVGNCHWSVIEERSPGWQLVEHNAGSLPEPVIGDEA